MEVRAKIKDLRSRTAEKLPSRAPLLVRGTSALAEGEAGVRMFPVVGGLAPPILWYRNKG